jgi:prepilin-type processing-associated H-X9-DG protein
LAVGHSGEGRQQHRQERRPTGNPVLNGSIPAGGNLLYLDGHTAWVKFQQMVVRTSGDPSFWW